MRKKSNPDSDQQYWQSDFADEIQWFHFQYWIILEVKSSSDFYTHMILTSVLKVFGIFMVKFDFKQTSTSMNMLDLSIKCVTVRYFSIELWEKEKIRITF